ncbi:hypothetical protein [Comamonas thiooxydans]|uniref:hypothetical protein n=1 Tax=Comamonas thiooxydans TaxID=363952 RepID=UPI000B4153C8|nr:hypothetical protein [Comamonas thiooxydans]
MSDTSATTKSALTVLAVMEALTGFAMTGASNKDLAEACKTTAVIVTRATQTLIAYGWCRKSEETGRFYPTPKFTRLTFRVLDDCQRYEQRMTETRHALTGQ